MDKYAQLKSFHHYRRLLVYMYFFMYVYSETMSVEDYFPATKTFVEKYNKMSTPGMVPKHYLGFSYTSSEDYEIDQKFDEI